jgi:general transcription factor 3C polypeptide 5 (transcription factor C subunit 1)
MQPSIESVTVPTNNLLLKITIPRRRKKMSRQSGNDCNRPNARARNESLLDKIRASKGHYTIEAVGTIDKTVRFRGIVNLLQYFKQAD